MKKALILFLFILSKNTEAQVSFAPPVTYAVGSSPFSITDNDFNNDGVLDLATTNYFGGNVSLLLGTGSGLFSTAMNFAAPHDNYSIVSADFNNDGNTDVGVTNGAANYISILIGNGLGGFSTPTTFSVASDPQMMVASDFNNDGNIDLATSNYNSNNVALFIGNGLGGFASALYFPVDIGCYGIICSDFNNDGKMDIATANANANSVSILINNGMGGFAAVANFSSGAFNISLSSGDFNEDGKLDIATANFNSNDVSVLLGNGTGGFGAATFFGLAGAIGPHHITNVDLNCDDHLDLAIVNINTNNMSIIEGNGTGSFSTATTIAIPGVNPGYIKNCDINNDGKRDLVTCNVNSSTVSVYINDFICITPLPCYTTTTANLTTGLLAYYPFGGGSLNDFSGNGHHLSNSTTAHPTADRNGNVDCAYNFTKANNEKIGMVAPTFVDNLTTSPFSISLWYKPIGTRPIGDYEQLIGRDNGLHCPDTFGQWSLGLYDCRKVVVGFDMNSHWQTSTVPDCTTLQAMITNQWHHTAFVFDGTNYKVYVDGILDSNTHGPCGSMSANIGNLLLGKDYTGDLDDILIYNRALTATEVVQIQGLGSSCCPATLATNNLTTIENHEIILYPNPTNDFINIATSGIATIAFKYKIVDVTGRIVQHGLSNSKEKISIQSLQRGHYSIQIETETGKIFTKKIIKN